MIAKNENILMSSTCTYACLYKLHMYVCMYVYHSANMSVVLSSSSKPTCTPYDGEMMCAYPFVFCCNAINYSALIEIYRAFDSIHNSGEVSATSHPKYRCPNIYGHHIKQTDFWIPETSKLITCHVSYG